MHRHLLQRSLIQRHFQNALLLLAREAPRKVGAELRFQQRNAIGATTFMSDLVFADDLVQGAAVIEFDGQRIGDLAFVNVVIITGIGWILDAHDLVAQGIDGGVVRDVVFVVGSSQAAV